MSEADVFTGESGDPGPRLVVLARELVRLREAAQAVVASSESDELPGTVAYRLVPANEIRSLRAVLESDGAPADRPAAATEDE